MQQNRAKFGARNEHVQFSKLEEDAEKAFVASKESSNHNGKEEDTQQQLFITADPTDGRL
jgi:hypothetical protein